jgi:hypothetical protein
MANATANKNTGKIIELIKFVGASKSIIEPAETVILAANDFTVSSAQALADKAGAYFC